MKKIFLWSLLIVGALTLSGLVFGVSYAAHCDWAAHEAVKRGDVYAWMQHEFHLNNAQLAKVKALEESYIPVCDKHCKDLAEAEAAIRKASSSEEKATQEAHLKELQAICQNSLMEHLKTVAAAMPKAEGDRYYYMMMQSLQCMGSSGMQHTVNTPR